MIGRNELPAVFFILIAPHFFLKFPLFDHNDFYFRSFNLRKGLAPGLCKRLQFKTESLCLKSSYLECISFGINC